MKKQTQQVTPPPSRPMFPIVGIGTSAGGLEALELFLRHVPAECGMAFVVIQHLSPTHVGNLPELLQRSTTMKVSQVDKTTRVQPDHVYVIPPNKDMSISKRTLSLQNPETETKYGLRLPIDSFFHSLAEDAAELSIGVILSGMGSDGSKGLCAIKEQGGLTLAQEPSSAKFGSMPKSAIDAGLVDIIAPAEELPARIIDFLGCATPRWKNEQDLREKEQSSFEKITTLLKAKTRHDFSLYKPTSLYRRIERRMSIHKIDSITNYAKFLQHNSHEVDLLFNCMSFRSHCPDTLPCLSGRIDLNDQSSLFFWSLRKIVERSACNILVASPMTLRSRVPRSISEVTSATISRNSSSRARDRCIFSITCAP